MPRGSRDRVRLWRERMREGTVCVAFKVCRETAEDLVALGWLRPGVTSSDGVRAALLDLLVHAIDARVRPPRVFDLRAPQGPRLGEVRDRHGVG